MIGAMLRKAMTSPAMCDIVSPETSFALQFTPCCMIEDVGFIRCGMYYYQQ